MVVNKPISFYFLNHCEEKLLNIRSYNLSKKMTEMKRNLIAANKLSIEKSIED